MLKEDFINKLRQKHPDNFNKYDYSLVPNEFKSKDKITIICPIHGAFEQIAGNQLQGFGCRKCAPELISIKKSIKKSIIFDRFKTIHGDRYSYVIDTHKNTSSIISIICQVHGLFKQRIRDHLKGTGCPKCGEENRIKIRKYKLIDFIKKSKDIHGNTYGYDDVFFTDLDSKVLITCYIHGNFLQAPKFHLGGQGCPKCANKKTIDLQRCTLEDFIRKARLIHGDKYDYSKVVYVNSHTKVIIVCPTHGEFEQTPNNHINGQGCPKCRESSGEKHISQILDKYHIKYNREYKINGQPYRYDFYLPEYNIYIEYHGSQHYIPAGYFGGKEDLNKTQRRDKAKIELIKRSSGLLITLKYIFKTKEQIEDELLRLFSIIHPEFLSNKELTKQVVINSNIYLIQDGISYIRK